MADIWRKSRAPQPYGHFLRGADRPVTPTGAALVHVLSSGYTPVEYTPIKSGFGAGSKDPADRPNALRIILAEEALPGARDDAGDQALAVLATDVDDMTAEHIAAAADSLRDAGALDVTCITVAMKKGRIGTRVEVLCKEPDADRLEALMFAAPEPLEEPIAVKPIDSVASNGGAR